MVILFDLWQFGMQSMVFYLVNIFLLLWRLNSFLCLEAILHYFIHVTCLCSLPIFKIKVLVFLIDLKYIFYLVRMFTFWMNYIKNFPDIWFPCCTCGFFCYWTVSFYWVELERKLFVEQVVDCPRISR